jgi:uncharacterized phiE125 gp8 family phage protein
MSLTLITPPAAEPVSLADLKEHLKIDGAAEDALLSGLLVAARQTIEARFQIAIMAQAWRLALGEAGATAVLLPIAPVLAIDAVGLVRGGATELLAPAAYEAETGNIGRVRLKSAPADAGLSIAFTAGWADLAAIPEALKLAVKLLAAHYYENREGGARAPDLGGLVAPFRQVRL